MVDLDFSGEPYMPGYFAVLHGNSEAPEAVVCKICCLFQINPKRDSNFFAVSGWVRIETTDSSLIRARQTYLVGGFRQQLNKSRTLQRKDPP